MDREEYTSDEGNYSSISSASGFSTFEDETDFKNNTNTTGSHPLGSTDNEKQFFLLSKTLKPSGVTLESPNALNVWNKNQISPNLLEKINEQLGIQNLHLENENKEWKLKFNTLQKEINRLICDKECRESCIQHLKNKITEQQESIHDLTQQNFKFNINLSTLNNELTTTKGTVDWYKTEWANANDQRNTLQKDVFILKNSLRNKKLEITRLEALVSDLKVSLEAKNIVLLQKILPEPQPIVNTLPIQTVEDDTSKLSEVNNEITEKYYSAEIEDLNKQILSVKTLLTQQTEISSQLLKEKTELLKKNTVLENEYDDYKVFHSLCEDKIKSLQDKYEYSLDTIKRKSNNILELKTNLNKLKIQLGSATKEKLLVQESINSTRNNFHKLVVLQDELKEELKMKNKLILTLEKKIQDNFMYENWNKCAIDEFAVKEDNFIENIKVLEAEIKLLKSDKDINDVNCSKLKLELDEIKKYCKTIMVTQNQRIDELKHLCSMLNVNESFDIDQIVENITSSYGHNLKSRLQLLEERCINASKHKDNAEQVIETLKQEIEKLQDCVYLSKVQMIEKQKRFDVHCHVLLKQVKEYKQDMKLISKENKELKNQQLNMLEELNTKKLELFQCELDKSSDADIILKKTEGLKQLRSVLKKQDDTLMDKEHLEEILKEKEDDLKQKHVVIDDLTVKIEELSRDYMDLVSTHSNCLSTIEAAENVKRLKELEQDKLDTDKIANCTIVNTQHALIEILQKEKSNALTLIKTMENMHFNDKAQIKALMQDKAFMQRLVIDMKAALNASAAKQQYYKCKSAVVPIDRRQFLFPTIPNINEDILTLCKNADQKNSSVNLQESVLGLKAEMSNMKNVLLSSSMYHI